MRVWPKFNALCDICETYGRAVGIEVGGIKKDDKKNNFREPSVIVISSGEKKLLTQRIYKGDFDLAAEKIQTQLSA